MKQYQSVEMGKLATALTVLSDLPEDEITAFVSDARRGAIGTVVYLGRDTHVAVRGSAWEPCVVLTVRGSVAPSDETLSFYGFIPC